MECPNCHYENRDTAKYCENCGNKLKNSCPNCGQLNRPGAKFCDNCGEKLEGNINAPIPDASIQSPISKFIPKDLAAKLESARANRLMEGERRVVTILFCDVNGSTAAAENLDPEEWTGIMNGAFEFMIQPVYRYEGTVARLMGDAVLAFFGAPIAHEDDPQRAVLAGLDIASGVQAYQEQVKKEWGIDFNVRVGINTGLVVVGAVGTDLRMEYTAMGDAINLAARMEQTATPGTIQIAADTYKLVAPYFIFEDRGGILTKGKEAPVQAYRVLGSKATPGRLRGIPGLEAPLIGRVPERSVLEQAIANLDKGLGGIVYLIGEAGLGKSRLIQDIQLASSQAADQEAHGATWYQTACLSYETGQAYALFRRLVRQLIGSMPDENPAGMRAKISQAIEAAPLEERPIAQRAFESLFGMAGQGGEPPLEGEAFKGLLYTAINDLWRRRAQAGPVIVVCDDLHWSDPASAALLQQLYPLTNQAALLLVCAMRPEREAPGWQAMQVAERDFPHRYTEINLKPLNTSESEALVDSLLSISDLPAGLRNRILEKSEGNPFFVEEVVRTLIDQGVVVQGQNGSRWQAAGTGQDLDIPGNLQTLLVARIDRLAEQARQTLQVASVVGRTFYYRVLLSLVDFAAVELDQNLISLQRAQLIEEAARLPELEYLFRHALTQEAAYSTILLKQRQAYHRRVGEALEALYPEKRDEMAVTLADHFFQARDLDKALHYYTLAGDAAYRLFATREALLHYERAIQCTEKAGASSEQLIHLYSRQGRAYELDTQFDQALRIYQEMVERADKTGDERLKLASYTAECIVRATQTPLYDPPKAKKLGEKALALARKYDDQVTEAKVLWGLLLVEVWSIGDNRKALDYGLRSLTLARQLGLREQMGFTYTNLVNVYWGLDQTGAARQAIHAAQAIWRELGNIPMLIDSFTMSQYDLLNQGELEDAVSIAQESLKLSRSIGNLWNQLAALLYVEISYREQGQVSRAIEIHSELLSLETINLFGHGELKNELSTYLLLGAQEKAKAVADELNGLYRKFIPLFQPENAYLIILAKILGGELEPAGQILEEAFQDLNLDALPSLTTGYVYLAEVHLLLAREEPERALEKANQLITKIHQIEFRLILPEVLWLQGKAYLALNEPGKARPVLEEALAVSRKNGERRVRWQILSALVELEERSQNQPGAQKLRAQAREVVSYIADHCPADLRAVFLERPEVRAIME